MKPRVNWYKIGRGLPEEDRLIMVRHSPISSFLTVSLNPLLNLHVPVGPKPNHEVLSYPNNKQTYNLT